MPLLTPGLPRQIHIFVFVRAQLGNALLERDVMWGLCDKALLQGEGGYYLTVFESAIQFVRAVRLLLCPCQVGVRSPSHHTDRQESSSQRLILHRSPHRC